MIAASTVSNTTSCTAHPNAGRIGRSPGAVPRISAIACSMSSTPPVSASAPRWSARSGKARPDPISSLMSAPPGSSEVDHRAADRDPAAAQLDLARAALEGQCGARLDRDLGLAAQVDLLGLGGQVTVGGDRDVFLGVDREGGLAAQFGVFRRCDVNLVIAQQGERAVVVLQQVFAGLVHAAEQRAENVWAGRVLVLEAHQHL